METEKKTAADGRRTYFIGIGGISMSSLALMAKSNGCEVAGYDRTESAMTHRLEKAGITVHYTYSPDNALGMDLAVYTSAIRPDDPEFLRVKELGIPTMTRAEYLGQLMLGYKTRIGVAGMHGKSTTTSMLASIYLADEALDPTVIVGAELTALGGAFRIGGQDSFLFEACEYTDSFLSFYPTTAVVLNIEMDHVDYFRSMEQIIRSFRRYLSIAERAVVNGDDANVRKALDGYTGEVVTYGLGEGNRYRAVNIEGAKPSFDLVRDGETVGRVSLGVHGRHNVWNALAALAASMENGIPFETAKRGLAAFCGTKRRFELRGHLGGTDGGAEVYDDYAHHPTEIRATLKTAREYAAERGGRLRVIYQPHTYSRTFGLYDDFRKAFADADEVIFADIYAAREENLWGVSSKQLALDAGGLYFPSLAEIAAYVKNAASPQDVIVVMGAGDIIALTDLLIA